LRYLDGRNRASITKLVWVVAQKKDLLDVKWVHGNYLRQKEWWNY